MKQTSAYLANQLGFSETGRYVLDTLILPRIQEIGIKINNPFIECGKELDFEKISKIERYEDRMAYWDNFSKKVTPINNELMKNSDCLLAILDGGPGIDDGVACEIGYYAGIEKGPIFALRSDFRGGENMATSVNPQILGYIIQSNGLLVDGPDAIPRWFAEVKRWHDFINAQTTLF